MTAFVKRSHRGEQAAGLGLAAVGTSRIKGIGRLVEVGTKAKNPYVASLARGTKHVHRYAGAGYDEGHRIVSGSRHGREVLSRTDPYTPHITAAVGAGMVAHGRRQKSVPVQIQGW